jgi:D-psicose/D-tagatose/L-ribulose 3-epimerase
MLLWTHFVTEKHYPMIETLKKIGYDGIELELVEGKISHYKEIGSYLKSIALEATAVTVMPNDKCNPISDNWIERENALDHLKWAIDSLYALGGNMLCGPFYQVLGKFSGMKPTQQERIWASEVILKASDYAKEADIRLAIEPLNRFESYFLNTIKDASEFVEFVGASNLGILFDTFHANIEEKNIDDEIKKFGKKISHVHISENDRGTPGKGHVDFDKIISSLRAVNYDGWLTIEAFGNAIDQLAATICIWRDISPYEEIYMEGYHLLKNLN